jgi:hypothetical protein
MGKIRITRYPTPTADIPQFVKDAYVGLVLTPVITIRPGQSELYPEGAYWFEIKEILRSMATHDMRAYNYLAAAWGELTKLEVVPGYGPQITFPFDCCEVVQ